MRHGKYETYTVGKCRCHRCREAAVEYMRRYRRLRRAQGPLLVADTEARARLQALRADGWSERVLADAAGVSTSRIHCTTVGKPGRLAKPTMDRILAITRSDLLQAKAGRVPSGPTLGLLGEMRCAGWTQTQLRRCMGGYDLIYSRPKSILVATARRAQDLHDAAWRDNANNFRQHCKCIKVAEPETTRNTEYQRELRRRRSAW